jgi:hypothetical protein
MFKSSASLWSLALKIKRKIFSTNKLLRHLSLFIIKSSNSNPFYQILPIRYWPALDCWEDTEVLNKCYDGVAEHIKTQIAKLVHARFNTLNLTWVFSIVRCKSDLPCQISTALPRLVSAYAVPSHP